MVINSIEFIVFIMAIFLIYYVMPKKFRWVVLLGASYIFYFASSTKWTIFLILTTLSIYFLGLKLGKIDDATKQKTQNLAREEKKKIKQQAKKSKKIWLIVGLIFNFGILMVLKYGNFFGGNLNHILAKLSIPFSIPEMHFILPLGISYYTLQATSYLIDVYRQKYPPDKNLGRIALFVSFFPQIVEGPIGRYDKLGNQLYEGHTFNGTQIKYSAELILWGFFKKMVIADRAALLVNPIFDSYAEYQGIVIVIAIVLYTVQIYAEFSGCMDIVRGTAGLFGVKLDENFRRPFASKSVEEFWRRWNITLGTWLKDYVFYSVSFSPLCNKIATNARKVFKGHIGKLIPAAFALFFVWFGNGMWHGASWKYICYGLYYYVIMMLGMLLAPLGQWIIQKLHIRNDVFSYRLWQKVRTFGFVCLGMLIFRASSLGVAFQMLKSIPTFGGIDTISTGEIFKLGFTEADAVVLTICVAIFGVVSILQERGVKIRETLAKQNLVFRWGLIYLMFFAILIFGIYGVGYNPESFIYGQF